MNGISTHLHQQIFVLVEKKAMLVKEIQVCWLVSCKCACLVHDIIFELIETDHVYRLELISGGPLVIPASTWPYDGFNQNIQVGITSDGPTPCGGTRFIGAYTNVAIYVPWIQDAIVYNNLEGCDSSSLLNVAAHYYSLTKCCCCCCCCCYHSMVYY